MCSPKCKALQSAPLPASAYSRSRQQLIRDLALLILRRQRRRQNLLPNTTPSISPPDERQEDGHG